MHLANGEYAENANLRALDLDLPTNCTAIAGGDMACGNDFYWDFSGQSRIILNYCPGHNSSLTDCREHRDLQLERFYQYSSASWEHNTWACYSYTTLGKQVCKTLQLK